MRDLGRAAGRLRAYPQIGRRLPDYTPRDVRGLVVGSYELRYEIVDDFIIMLRIWHAREHR
jgi:plasmid stabilization system protein ParE